tara:strand:- start:173 stop:1483 length:1311 start_codon:yes stop_codon:yes gene_type:complete
MANGYLYRSGANSGASGTTATVSMWVRKHDESAGDGGFFQFWSSGSNFCSAYANPTLKMRNYIAGGYSQGDITCNRLLRDHGAWYHLQCVWDTTNSTAGDRMRIYINGVRETSFSSSSNPSSSYAFGPLESGTFYLNRYNANTTTGSQSYSHVHYCDGYAYEPTVFGETDTTTGEWKIKTSPTCNYGSNGFFILKDGSSTTDQSGNSKTFTTSGTLTNTEDCPSNVFATWNALDNYYASATLTNGNTKVATNSSAYSATLTSLGASSGKYYAEFKLIDKGSGYCQIGIKGKQPTSTSDGVGAGSDGLAYRKDGYKVLNGSSSTYGTSYDNNDIIGIAMDLDNNRLFFSKNGTFQDSGDPTSSTGAITIPTSSSGFYFMGISDEHNNGTNTWEANFGNGYFGTTAISSEGTNASGIGKFELDVPTGYTALSTKGLNE